MEPGISTASGGIPETSIERPPKMVRRANEIERPIAPQIINLRLPSTSIRIHAMVIRRKYEK